MKGGGRKVKGRLQNAKVKCSRKTVEVEKRTFPTRSCLKPKLGFKVPNMGFLQFTQLRQAEAEPDKLRWR